MYLQWCGKKVENSFGPTVRDCRGGFDFTVFFEQLFLAIVPSAAFVLLATFRVYRLCRASPKARGGWLLPLKTVAAATYVILQLYLVVRWAASPPFPARAATPAAVLSLLAGCTILVLSPLEHLRALRPSTLLQSYLLLTLLFDAALCRTIWLIGRDPAIERVFAAVTAVKSVLLCLEIVEKRRWLKPQYRSEKPEALGGIVNRSLYWWLNRLFLTGYRKILVLADIDGMEESHRAEALERSLKESWAKLAETELSSSPSSPCNKPHALLRTLAWTLRRSLAATVFPRLCAIGFKFAQPFLIGSLIRYLDAAAPDSSAGNGLIGAFALVYSGVAVSTGLYWYQAYRTITMVRGSLIAVVYARTLELDLNAPSHASPSTLMSTDVERICTCLVNLHELWANVIEVGLAIYILETQLGAACIGIAFLAIACGLGTLLLTKSIGKRQEAWLKAVQKRLRATEATLGSIKSIKMMGWTEPMQKLIQGLRVDELRQAMRYRRLQVISITVSLVMTVAGPATAITTFTVISDVKGTVLLLPGQAFTSIAVLALIATPLITLFQALPLLKSAVASMARIQDFLNQPCLGDTRQGNDAAIFPRRPSNTSCRSNPGSSNIAIQMEEFETGKLAGKQDPGGDGNVENLITMSKASMGWGGDGDRVVLHKINLAIKRGSLAMVIGPVGCGKSTLLKTMLGETKVCQGAINVLYKEVAFSDQTPWMMFGTIQDNITGKTGYAFDETWYRTVLYACALEKDLEQLPDGDQTRIGSKGIALSGGQRQRVSMARVLYSRKRLAIFDDVFAGLDRNTEIQVFARVFGPSGLLRQQNITAVLVTNKVHQLPSSTQIIALDESGHISQQGAYAKLCRVSGYVQNLSSQAGSGAGKQDDLASKEQTSVTRATPAANTDRAAELARQTGDISLYQYYLKFAGAGTFVFAICVLSVYSFCIVFPTIWLDWWSTANEKRPGHNLGMYLGIYIFLGVLGLAALSLFCWQMILVLAPRAGRKLHSTILASALCAPLSFLTQTDMGTIMNRFSQDMQLIDFQVTLTSMSAAEAFSTTIFRLVVVCVTAKYVATIMPLSLFVVYVIQKGYLRTSRQLRYLDLEAKAPIYTLFVETLDGLATIRAFGWQEPFRRHGHALLDGAQRPFYLLNCIQRWLGFVLDMLLTGVSVLVVVFAVRLRSQTSGGTTGVALVNILSCHQNLAGFVLRWTLLETSIGAVSRIRAFSLQCPTELREAAVEPPANWPQSGSIQVQNISASYSPDAPVLKNVTCSIPPGSKIGICGRTGSGKSSFVLCLLQMLDLDGGHIAIDGVDLSTLSREAVRSAFVSVPQDSMLFEGSVRFNLDPRGLAADQCMQAALRKVQLWDLVDRPGSDSGGLDSPIGDLHLSHGQRQLFSLARALLSKAKIIVLDEATSSMDKETNKVMQSLIRSEFYGCTVLCVDHHLENILDYDAIVYFDDGSLVEFASPDVLLQSNSKFQQLVKG